MGQVAGGLGQHTRREYDMINKKACRKYCCEDISKIENYNKAIADKTQTWDCHHRLEVQGQFFNSRELLKRCGMYWNRPANELVFLTRSKHRKLHTVGKSCSEESRRKMSEAQKGKRLSEETRKKLSDAHIGRKLSEETRRKMSESRRGKHHSEETRRKMSETKRTRRELF